MVAYAAPSTDAGTGFGPYSGSVTTLSGQQSTGGLYADDGVGLSTWSGPSSWAGLLLDPVDLAGHGPYSGSVTTLSGQQSTGGLYADDGVGLSTWSGPSSWAGRLVDSLAGVGVGPYSGSVTTLSGQQSTGGLYADGSPGLGAFIPSAYFRTVSVDCVNKDGEPIEDARWLVSQDALPTAARVEDGRADIYLLRQAYDDFVLLVDSGQPNVDYVWFELVDVQLDTTTLDATLVFNEETPGGTYASGGVRFGL